MVKEGFLQEEEVGRARSGPGAPNAVALALALATFIGAWLYFVPWLPIMPTDGLDPSWTQAMLYAVEHRLRIGVDVIFTFGPYSGIYTGAYRPSTDTMTLAAAALFATAFASVVLRLFGPRRRVAAVALLFAIWVLGWMKDPFFLAYPLFMVLLQAQAETARRAMSAPTRPAGGFEYACAGLHLVALGLIPLIKGSFLIFTVACWLCLLWLVRARWRFASMVLVIPGLAEAMFWVASGQRLGDLVAFATSLSPIVSGYTSAMMLPGPGLQTLVYACLAACAVGAVGTRFRAMGGATWKETAPVWAALVLFAFMSAKAAFVRHDGHAFMASGALVVLAATLWGLAPHGVFRWAVSAASLAGALWIFSAFAPLSAAMVGDRLTELGIRAPEAAWMRVEQPDHLPLVAGNAWADIRRDHPLQLENGTVDTYSNGQARLLASGNAWNPRPIFQSYSAYTPTLQKMNAAHLAGNDRPDVILFSVEPIDGRYPSMEDGVQWAQMKAGYRIAPADPPSRDYLRLVRRDGATPIGPTREIRMQVRMGDEIAVPASAGSYIADIDIDLTTLGKVAQAFYKTSILTLRVTLANGDRKRFRFVAGMGHDFLLSPLVENQQEFGEWMQNDMRALAGKSVVSFSISPNSRQMLWRDTFEVTLKENPAPVAVHQ
ncbi:hypothetical protein GN316_11535 [Xylophilus sp. Kf1]|nr:hypothetical protein [Xylophilus sp. Kf1]